MSIYAQPTVLGAKQAEKHSIHQLSISRFQDALHAPMDGNSNKNASQGDTHGKALRQQCDDASRLAFQGLPPGVFGVFNESLQQAFSDETSLVEHLVEAVAKGVQAGKRLQGDGWRFSIRLKPELLEMTALEMSCFNGRVVVVLRTSSGDSYRLIVSALSKLNSALSNQQLGDQCATVLLVNAKEIV
jgi:Flagellar hook-length control protein FliK